MHVAAGNSLHALTSDYVRDQLRLRTVDVNGKRYRPDGGFVLYWMQSTHRLRENWALRAAIRTANRINRPLVVHQGLDPTYPHAASRHHTFILEGARDTAQDAAELGLAYQFVLRARRDDDRRVVDRIASQAYVVFTDLFPTAGVQERTQRFAQRVSCRVLAVDSVCTVPSGIFATAEYAARTIRPKIARLLAHSLEPVLDDVPRVPVSAALHATLADLTACATLSLGTHTAADIAADVARCEIDHHVTPVATVGGRRAALQRLHDFVAHDLAEYAETRNEASLPDGTSNLSPYLHYGHVAGAEVVRAALATDAPSDSVDAFVQQATTWRELSYNWCVRTPDFASLSALPEWIRKGMDAHAADARPVLYDLDTLERGATDDALWNAAQNQLRDTGIIHNYPRMLWGKTMLLWTPTYEQARSWLFHLNDKWALDGRDANSVGGIMWCFGLWDRPWGNKPIWGGIRPMVTARAKRKFDVPAYIAQH